MSGKGGTLKDSDSDVESEIEIIYEGNGSAKAAPSAANGQEGPEAPESHEAEAEAVTIQPQKPQKPVLSKQQQEEAGKAAEQRKRFDNQRYQRETASAVAGGRGSPSPQFDDGIQAGSPHGRQEQQQEHEQQQQHGGGGAGSVGGPAPRFEMVMGLNLTEALGQDPLCDDSLPGGIQNDSPRAGRPSAHGTRKQNRHDLFDDDDEMLMKEILETIEA